MVNNGHATKKRQTMSYIHRRGADNEAQVIAIMGTKQVQTIEENIKTRRSTRQTRKNTFKIRQEKELVNIRKTQHRDGK